MTESPATQQTFDFTEDAPPPESMAGNKSSYSLLLLFYLTTVAAISAAVCRLAFVETTWSGQAIVIGYLIAGTGCVLMATVIGYLIGRTWISTLLGLFAGLICGLVALLMTLVQPTDYESAGMIVCAGCWMLSLVAIVGNRWQRL